MYFGAIWCADESSSCPQAIRTIVSGNVLSAVVEGTFLTTELRRAIRLDTKVSVLHHDNVSLRLFFWLAATAVLTHCNVS